MIKLFPKPFVYDLNNDKTFSFSKKYNASLTDYKNIFRELDINFEINKDFIIDNKLENEGYKIEITNTKVSITANSEIGLFYANISLYQLYVNYDNKIPCFTIIDKPNFEYRGFMLDVGRYYFKMEDIYRLIDLCAYHKINKFHLHLTEDQGWRIEIKKYPLLTSKGSRRSHTNFDCKKQEGFYSQEDIKNIIQYCHDRFMEVIPEIDMPGHMQAALACYPELGCFDRKLPVATHWGIKHDILCAGKDSSYEFICNVLDELCELFDSKYFHIGGDEAVKTRWKQCPHCQAKMKELNLKNEDELQSYFMNQIASHLKKKNKQPIMWNEYEPTGTIDKSIIWQLWAYDTKDIQKQVEEFNEGRKMIFSSSSSTYIDLPYQMVPMKNCFTYYPELENMNEENILGVETPLWSEFVPNYKTAIKRTLPRIGALSEMMWTNKANRSEEDFMKNLNTYCDFYTSLGYSPITTNKINPTKLQGFFQRLWFEKRQLCWHGLHNLIDNLYVKNKYKNN